MSTAHSEISNSKPKAGGNHRELTNTQVIKTVKLNAHFLPITSTAKPQKNAPPVRPADMALKTTPCLPSGTPNSW